MRLVSLELESSLRQKGLWPESRIAWAALYLLALDFLLFAAQLLTTRLSPRASGDLAGWVTFLSILVIVLLAVLALRWLRANLLWRLRNRLIVTYVFIGVIPVFLLVVISLISLYLFAGQFASFVITSDIATRLQSLEASNRAIAHALATRLASGEKLDATLLNPARPRRPEWVRREVCAAYVSQAEVDCSGPAGVERIEFPSFLTGDFREIVRDKGKLYLRAASVVNGPQGPLRVVSSESLDKALVEEIASDLGEVTFSLNPGASTSVLAFGQSAKNAPSPVRGEAEFSAGVVPAATGSTDRQIDFPVPLPVVEWSTGEKQRAGALARVETRPSALYNRLFAALGDYAKGIEYILLSIAIFFAVIEVLALWIGTKLTRSITSAVADLYEATTHVNRGDFSHRIAVKSHDQLATLANSFNSMTTSIERLVLEQKEKQRLENELTIAQEVQAQLFPRQISQIESLEVHGFCRPARTVSGDYYDFLRLAPDKMILAVGDISGKGISAALLMATIHSAVRAYSIEGIPLLRETSMAGGRVVGATALANAEVGPEVSPATLLGLLNQQLYHSTPDAKYATLFLGHYDGGSRCLTYSNGGHLPPILVSRDGTADRLACGGTVVGLLNDMTFPEATVHLRPGDLLVAFSDGVTEPENDYGEFGEHRLIQIVQENRHLSLERITAAVTAAVDDWIGEKEQPDDVTLVLARAR